MATELSGVGTSSPSGAQPPLDPSGAQPPLDPSGTSSVCGPLHCPSANQLLESGRADLVYVSDGLGEEFVCLSGSVVLLVVMAMAEVNM